MLIIAIEHCNGEIMDIPIIIYDLFELDKYRDGPYLLYLINLYEKTVKEID